MKFSRTLACVASVHFSARPSITVSHTKGNTTVPTEADQDHHCKSWGKLKNKITGICGNPGEKPWDRVCAKWGLVEQCYDCVTGCCGGQEANTGDDSNCRCLPDGTSLAGAKDTGGQAGEACCSFGTQPETKKNWWQPETIRMNAVVRR